MAEPTEFTKVVVIPKGVTQLADLTRSDEFDRRRRPVEPTDLTNAVVISTEDRTGKSETSREGFE